MKPTLVYPSCFQLGVYDFLFRIKGYDQFCCHLEHAVLIQSLSSFIRTSKQINISLFITFVTFRTFVYNLYTIIDSHYFGYGRL